MPIHIAPPTSPVTTQRSLCAGHCNRSPASFVVDNGAENCFISTQYAALVDLPPPKATNAIVVLAGVPSTGPYYCTPASPSRSEPISTPSLSEETSTSWTCPDTTSFLASPGSIVSTQNICCRTDTLRLSTHSRRGRVVLHHQRRTPTPDSRSLSATQVRRHIRKSGSAFLLSVSRPPGGFYPSLCPLF